MVKPLCLAADQKRGTSPIIGNILLLAIVIVLAVVMVTLSLSFLEGLQPKSPNVVTDGTITDGEIRFVHRSGVNLDTSNLEVVVRTQDETKRVPFSQGTLTGEETSFSAGNRWRYCQVAEPGSEVETTLVHTQSNSVLSKIEQSAQETQKTGLEYRCGSAARRSGRGGGWATFSMKNFATEDVDIETIKLSSDTEATKLDGLNESGVDHTEVYIDANGDEVYNYPPEDAYAYASGSADYTIGSKIDVISVGTSNNYASIQPGATAHFSLYQFQDASDNYADIRGAKLTVTIYFIDRPPRTYSIILPRTLSG
nr:type IV pilin N-terminal domain-containing protein [Halovenus rubra]